MKTEALLLSVIQKLDSKRVETPGEEGNVYEKAANELRVILDLLRGGLGEMERSGRLNNWISDVIDIALDLDDCSVSLFYKTVNAAQGWLERTKMGMLMLIDHQLGSVDIINAGEEEDDDDDDVVGLEKDVEQLLRRSVFNKQEGFSISIVSGMAGIGKTALARQVYNHASVVERYERRRASLVVVPAVETDSSLLEKMDNRILKDMIHLHLIGVVYFIVFDDVPNHLSIYPFSTAFPYQVAESRLLLVSRSYYDQIAVRTDYIHAMTSLDFEKSWQLFLKTIFSGSDERKFPQHLVNKGMMLKKCGGLLLAIKQIGRQIAEKRLLGGEWEEILESIDFSETMESLESSYDELDPPLKSCFLHAAFFKENKAIRPEKLMHIWAIGGMVSKSTTVDCLDMLLKQSIIEVEYKSICNLLKSCRINSLLHRLSMKKAEEEIGFEILTKGGGKSRPSSWSPPRHRVVKCSRDEFDYSSTDQDKHLVSIIFHGGGYLDTSSSYWKSAELLRILDFEDFGLKSFPVDISKSTELRYLGLRNNFIQELPHSLGCLKRLEVLDIAHNFTVEVPDITWEMDNLTHMYMSDIICRKPLKMDRLQNLKTLAYISVENWEYEISDLYTMTSLEKLGIEEMDGSSDGDWLLGSLVEFENLQQLTLRGFRFRSMPCLDELRSLHEVHTLRLDGLLARLANKFPPSLERLTLVNSCLEEDPMPVLERLRPLQCLKLRNAYTGRQMVVSDEGFQHLKFLCIQDVESERCTSWRWCNEESRESKDKQLSVSRDHPRRDGVDGASEGGEDGDNQKSCKEDPSFGLNLQINIRRY